MTVQRRGNLATIHYYLFLPSEAIYLKREHGNDVKDRNEILPNIFIQGSTSFEVMMVNMTILNLKCMQSPLERQKHVTIAVEGECLIIKGENVSLGLMIWEFHQQPSTQQHFTYILKQLTKPLRSCALPPLCLCKNPPIREAHSLSPNITDLRHF